MRYELINYLLTKSAWIAIVNHKVGRQISETISSFANK